jgi:insertion element IS1 protein InsB
MTSCKFCGANCIKKGWQCKKQKLFCRSCKKYQQLTYSTHKINSDHRDIAVFLNNEGCSISTIARFIKFSKTTICKIINSVASRMSFIFLNESGCEYELDELRTFVGNKKNESWIMYALNKITKRVVAFVVGRRTKEKSENMLRNSVSLFFASQQSVL